MEHISPALQFIILFFSNWINRRQQDQIDYLLEENRVLLELLKADSKRLKLNNDQRLRLALKGKKLPRQDLNKVAGIVRPETILAWFRKLAASKYDSSKSRSPGRPRKHTDIIELIISLAIENPDAGYTDIRNRLYSLGHDIKRSTLIRRLKENGIEPAPERNRKLTWSTFLKAHMEEGTIAAMDFFSVEVLTLFGIIRYHVLFVMDLATRKVHIAGIVSDGDACGAWAENMARLLTDCEDGFLRDMKYLILDNDPLFTTKFRELLRFAGVKPVKIPSRSPNLNSFAERFVLSIKSQCLNHIIPLGENHLRKAVSEYIAYYNNERFHQGIGGKLIEPNETAYRSEGKIKCSERMGGLLKYYYRDAA